MKSYSDIEQSKKLAKILPLESADMYYIAGDACDINFGSGIYEEIADWFSNGKSRPVDIPCWSLAALLNVIPQELFDGEYIIDITEGSNNKWIISYDPPYDISSYLNVSGDNLIDCCVEMIIKLKERKLL